MTTIECPHSPLSAPPVIGRVLAAWRKLTRGRSQWGLADQILISGTNFATMVFAAWGLGKAGFGQFAAGL